MKLFRYRNQYDAGRPLEPWLLRIAGNTCRVYITGDLTGIPLLKFASDSGARVVQTIVADPKFQSSRQRQGAEEILDLVIVGAGVSGMAAALEAKKHGLNYQLLEATEPFSTCHCTVSRMKVEKDDVS